MNIRMIDITLAQARERFPGGLEAIIDCIQRVQGAPPAVAERYAEDGFSFFEARDGREVWLFAISCIEGSDAFAWDGKELMPMDWNAMDRLLGGSKGGEGAAS